MSIKNDILNTLKNNYRPCSTLALKDIYDLNQTYSQSMIREMVHRLVLEGKIIKVMTGIVQIPLEMFLLDKAPIDYYGALDFFIYTTDKIEGLVILVG